MSNLQTFFVVKKQQTKTKNKNVSNYKTFTVSFYNIFLEIHRVELNVRYQQLLCTFPLRFERTVTFYPGIG